MSNPIPSPPPDASATRRGLVNLAAQTFAGLKTFAAGIMLGARLRFTGLSAGDVAIELPTGSKVTGGELEPELIRFAGGGVMDAPPPTPPTTTLSDSGAGESIIKAPTGPALALKKIRGAGVASVTATADTVDVAVPAPPVPTLADSGSGHSLIKAATGPAMELKKLVQGSGVVLTPTEQGVEIAAAAATPTTLGSVGAGETAVVDGTGPTLSIKSFAIEAGSGLTIRTDANRILIGVADSGWQNMLTYEPSAYESRTRVRVGQTWGAWSSWSHAGTRGPAWILRGEGNPHVRKWGPMVIVQGIVTKNPNPINLPPDWGDDFTEVEYRWTAGAPNPRAILRWPGPGYVRTTPGVARWMAPGHSFMTSPQGSGLQATTEGVWFESSAGPDAYSSWLGIFEVFMV